MSITRRRFLGGAVYAGTGVVAVSFLDPSLLFAAPEQMVDLGRHATGEQMAATPATFYRAYRSKPSTSPNVTSWLQIDLGKSQSIDAVKLYPACERMYPLLDEYYGGDVFLCDSKLKRLTIQGFRAARSLPISLAPISQTQKKTSRNTLPPV